MSTSSIAVLIVFICYLIMMILVGVFSMTKTNNTEDYFLGGRGLGSWVAALSAQASDMSGWLLMGLPGSVYAFGTGQIWIAVGLFTGTVLNWLLISKRLRRYTIIANNSLTLPEFFQNRFHDTKKILLGISSIVIVVFFLVYTASALASGGKLFNNVFGIDYHVSLAIGAIVILVYTFLGGFLAVCNTDFIQGMLMFVALLAVPIVAYNMIDMDFMVALTQSGVTNSNDYMSLFSNGGKPYTFVDIISQLAWGLGYCGMPHILVRFMAIRSEREIKKSSVIAIVWVAISLFAACAIGLIGRALLGGNLVDSENVFIQMIQHVFSDNIILIVIAVLAFIIAWNPDSSIMELVSDAWAGLGSAFGPLVVCSLFWKRTNLPGAVAGIVSGGVFVIVWDYLPLVGGTTLYKATGIYSLLLGFFVSLACIFVVSLCTKKPDPEIIEEFEQVGRYKESE